MGGGSVISPGSGSGRSRRHLLSKQQTHMGVGGGNWLLIHREEGGGVISPGRKQTADLTIADVGARLADRHHLLSKQTQIGWGVGGGGGTGY